MTKVAYSVILFLLLCTGGLSLSCGGGDESQTLLRQIQDGLKAAGRPLDFQIVLPAYLPAGTARAPVLLPAPEDGITMQFNPSGGVLDGDHPAVMIAESASGKVSPPNPLDPRVSSTSVDGRHVIEQRGFGSSTSILLYSKLGSVHVFVTVRWIDSARKGRLLADKMEQEALKVLKSMAAD